MQPLPKRWFGCSSACGVTIRRQQGEAAGIKVVMNRCPKIRVWPAFRRDRERRQFRRRSGKEALMRRASRASACAGPRAGEKFFSQRPRLSRRSFQTARRRAFSLCNHPAVLGQRCSRFTFKPVSRRVFHVPTQARLRHAGRHAGAKPNPPPARAPCRSTKTTSLRLRECGPCRQPVRAEKAFVTSTPAS